MFGTIVALVPHIQAGKLRALAVTNRKRSALLPDVPTLAEAGLPDYQSGSWYGVLVPAGTPRPIIDRLHGTIVKALQQPDVAQRLAAEGAEVIGSTPEEFAGHIKAELARVADVVRAAGIKIE
jgi:tripartite-type tricarboxylate transporter receptor subunit TctC